MDAARTFAATSASFAASHTTLAERMAHAEVALAQNKDILIQIQSHLGLPPVTMTAPIQPTTHGQSVVSASAGSLNVLTAAAIVSDLPTSTPPTQ